MKETLKKTLTLMLRAHILGTFKLNHAYNLGVVQASKMVLESMDMEERVVEVLLGRASMWANDKCPGLRDVPKTCQPGCDDCTKWVNGAVATYLAGATNLPVPPLTEQLTFGVWYITQCPGRHCLKEDFRFQIVDHRSFDQAIVTAGGVDTTEVDPHTMASRLVSGLYFAGEVLDVDGDTGGYNLQAAFSTGWAAGLAAAREALET